MPFHDSEFIRPRDSKHHGSITQDRSGKGSGKGTSDGKFCISYPYSLFPVFMQNAKDSFYLALRTRLAAINPERTVLLRGALRPGILVEEAEAPLQRNCPPDVFVLRWLGLGVDMDLSSAMAAEDCEILYSTCGTQAFGGLDRGRMLSAMDEEVMAMLAALLHTETQLLRSARDRHANAQSSGTSRLSRPSMCSATGSAARSESWSTATRSRGNNDGQLVFSARTGRTSRARLLCSCQSRHADSGTLRSFATRIVQSRRAARSVD